MFRCIRSIVHVYNQYREHNSDSDLQDRYNFYSFRGYFQQNFRKQNFGVSNNCCISVLHERNWTVYKQISNSSTWSGLSFGSFLGSCFARGQLCVVSRIIKIWSLSFRIDQRLVECADPDLFSLHHVTASKFFKVYLTISLAANEL